MPNLQHQHSRVRLAVVEALAALVSRGCVPAGLVQSNVSPVLRPLAYDRLPAVRAAMYLAVAHWLGYAPGPDTASAAAPTSDAARTGTSGEGSETGAGLSTALLLSRETAASLLPMLLLGVSDEQAPLAEQALGLLEGVGEVWARAVGAGGDAAEPAPMQGIEGAGAGAGTASAAADGAPQEASGGAGGGGDAGSDASTSGIDAAVAACQLGPPFRGRPAVGARRMASSLLPLLLPPLLRELSEWTVSLRACAARQLRTLLVLVEGGITAQLPRLLPALCSAIGDEDGEVAANIIVSVHTLGAHVQVSRWLPLILDQVSK